MFRTIIDAMVNEHASDNLEIEGRQSKWRYGYRTRLKPLRDCSESCFDPNRQESKSILLNKLNLRLMTISGYIL